LFLQKAKLRIYFYLGGNLEEILEIKEIECRGGVYPHPLLKKPNGKIFSPFGFAAPTGRYNIA